MVDRVVLLSLVSFDRWVPAAEIAAQLGTGEARIRSILADLIADGEPIDASASGYRRYAVAAPIPVPPVSPSDLRRETTARVADATSGFGALLRRHRVAAGLSQVETARRARIDPAYVSRIESGKATSQPSRHVVLSLAEAFGLDDAETDRFLFTAGLAPCVDYQALWEGAAEAIHALRRLPLPESSNVLTWSQSRLIREVAG